jgi:hypothetical protein
MAISETFDNFAFDEALGHSGLDTRTRHRTRGLGVTGKPVISTHNHISYDIPEA